MLFSPFVAVALATTPAQASAPASLLRPSPAATSPTPAVDAALEKAFDEAVKRFGRLSSSKRKALLRAIDERAREVSGPFGQLLGRIDALAKQRAKARSIDLPARTRRKRTKLADPDLHDALPFAVRRAYAWGLGSIGECKLERKRRSKKAAESEGFRAKLAGYSAASDARFAALLRLLDSDRGGDRIARFLEHWQHEGRSFYRALDKGAGRDASVFVYDAMLADFTQSFLRRNSKGKKRGLMKSLDATQKAMHESFLKYRQYRAVREAVACTVLLDARTALPAALTRYERGPQGGYSIRQQIQILLVHFEYDVERLATWLQEATGALPEDIWDAGTSYSPGDGFQDAFQREIPRMLERFSHTDRLLEAFVTQRDEHTQQMRGIVQNAAAEHGLRITKA